MKLFTIGFTKTSAEGFFNRLQHAGAKRVIDTRLNKDSQLAGFAKRGDLTFFLSKIAGIGYSPAAELAPTADLLGAYRKRLIDWPEYERQYLNLLRDREIEKKLDPASFEDACLLCSEVTPRHCHRRLAAEYLSKAWGEVEIVHL